MLNTTRLAIIFLCIIVLGCNDSNKNETKTQPDNTHTKTPLTPLFTKLSPEESGIQFVNNNKESDRFNFYTYEYFYNGGGVAVADFNNDGLQDIYFTASMALNKLYINQGGLKFVDITATANVNSRQRDWCTGVTIVDINNDGWQDIFVSRSGWFKNENQHLLRNLLFVNNGDLTFTERGIEYGFTDLSPTTQACFFDSDNDGDLDVYQINHPTIFKSFKQYKNGEITKMESKDHDFSDKFYVNKNGKFTDKTKALGFENSGHGLGVISSDFNNDGWQDLYVSNDYSEPDYIYINQKNGTYKNEMLSAFKHISKFSMGVDVADINNDGYQDIFNAEMLAKDNFSKKANMAPMNPTAYWYYVDNGYHYQDMHNSLQLNNGNGTFSEIAWLSNIAETNWSWCPLFADFDNDGFKDLFVSNGYKRDVLSKDFSNNLKGQMEKEGTKRFTEFVDLIPSTKISNYIFKNNKDLTFTDKTEEWGINFQVNSNGAAYADFDNDGDLDIVINNLDEKALIFKNNKNGGSNFMDIQLVSQNKTTYGAKVEILDRNKYQVSELTNAKGYQSISEKKIHFGLGNSSKIDSVLVTWANGKKTLLKGLEINKTHTINYGDSNFISINKPKGNKTYFEDVTAQIKLNYVHHEKEFDDYEREVLLPHKLSQEGPFMDVADVNGDGLDDFFVGSGAGYAGQLFIQNASGGFSLGRQDAFDTDKLCEDIGVLFFDYDNDGDQDLYVVSGSNEYGLDSPYMQDRLYQNDGKGNFEKTENLLPKMQASGSCVKASDYDKDGDLDVFVGGFQVPNQYPKPGKSFLLQNDKGVFTDVTNTLAIGLQDIGMVKDAVFADLNKDGKTDLVVAGHWMPIEIYIYDGQRFNNESEAYKVSEHKGWWNTLLIEDIDNDGFKDIIAGNLGTNTKHKATPSEPFKIYANDFDKNGTNDIVLGYYNQGVLYPVRGKQCSAEQIPELNNKVKSYNEFGLSNLEQIYGTENLEEADYFAATNFYTSIFKNVKGEQLLIQSLPNQTQFAPTNAIISIDVNKDNLKDLVLVGNHYPVEVETGRYDAHPGNVLTNRKTNGSINFFSENIVNTGFFANNDNRDIKKITIGKFDYLIISSNRNKIQFFKVN